VRYDRPVERSGVLGLATSVNVAGPDGNIIKISSYC
jgi:hypothetical protein